jgi:hypothetical protein
MLERKGGERGGAGGGEWMQDIEGSQPARSTRQAENRNKTERAGCAFWDVCHHGRPEKRQQFKQKIIYCQ